MKNNIHDVIASITAILIHNGLSELSLGDTDELTEPTNVVWYDKDGNPYDDRVTGVFWDGEELSLEVEAGEFYQRERIYSYDFAFSNIDWLRGVRDNMLEVLQRDGRRRCPACGRILKGRQKFCSEECRKFMAPEPSARDVAEKANKHIRRLIAQLAGRDRKLKRQLTEQYTITL